MPSTAPTIGFLDMPPEIRNEIYHLAVDDIYEQDAKANWADAMIAQPALLNTNRVVRSELLPIYYARISLAVQGTPRPLAAFTSLVQGAHPAAVSSIAELGFIFPCGTVKSNIKLRCEKHVVLLHVTNATHAQWSESYMASAPQLATEQHVRRYFAQSTCSAFSSISAERVSI
ncbi:hypothetical protein LTR85_006638 [Meristemomyces frigidus]|nr:hypothetical protein LTR85_006638 [Meristemomyces frigidus]